ncbi:MAG TPA: hypothetical protein VKF81_16985 [Blastocatellia bacterium]|nr:hypothetical protein [Blastocatellia bacterium]
MKGIVRLLTAALSLTTAAIPAHSYNVTIGLPGGILDLVAHTKKLTGWLSPVSSLDFVVSKFDRKITKAFEKAWQRSGGGRLPVEGVVLIMRMSDGTFRGKEMGATNEYKRFTFAWHPAAIAIVHTHPDGSPARPSGDDIIAADKHRIPVFTITSRGMFVYDPGTRKTSKLMDNLDWLDQSKWDKIACAGR